MSFSSGGSAAQLPVPGYLANCPTPLHIFYESLALEDARELKTGLFSGLPRAELYYSVKTNPLPPLLKCLVADGWGLEVVGSSNMAAAEQSAATADRLVLNGAAWRRRDLEAAIFEKGITNLTLDSEAMASLLAAVLSSAKSRAIKLNVALRLHDGASHFGFPLEQESLRRALFLLPKERIASLGLHIHRNPAGSARGISDIASDFRQRCLILQKALSVLNEAGGGTNVDYLDLGGGIDSPFVYRPHPDELARFHNPREVQSFRDAISPNRFSLREAGAEIGRIVKEVLGAGWAQKRILFEPGRSVCTRALSTLVEVRAVKPGFYPDAQVVLTDGNTATLGPLHRGIHPLTSLGINRGGVSKAFVYGSLPHSADWLFQSVPLAKLEMGDRLLIAHTGAYFLPLEAEFGHGRPAIYHGEREGLIRAP
ncbi:MAG TPA: hypothetical protein VIH99_00825 [Bdellovibrionota bacterium]|jgi:diaminopimelate decarboxylase